MSRPLSKVKEEARRLFLSGEGETNAEIAGRLRLKPHTVGKWRREEQWDDLKVKIDRRAAEMFGEKLASERVSLNIRHYRLWDVVVANLAESLKTKDWPRVRELERVCGVLKHAQQGQRLAKGLSMSGETEETIRAQAELEQRQLIDAFIDAVKEHVDAEETRDRIRQSILKALPQAEDSGAGESDDSLV
ncbi:MAG: hypothetical protein U0527_07235 [Candidatus Eisenbacteria bacterium]